MQLWLINLWRILSDWLRAALNNAQAVRRSRMLPAWLAVTGIAIDFGLMGLWFRYTEQSWGRQWMVSCGLMFLVRLATVSAILVWVCRRYQIPGAALGLRPSTMRADFQWSFRICALTVLVTTATIVAGLAATFGLGMRLPEPPGSFVQFLGGGVRECIVMAGIGVTGNMLVVVTEELIYRSLFLPPLTCSLGLYPAVAVTAIVFGLAHVIPFGRLGIPVPEIIGGVLMAGGFAIRWSVIPAMVIHAMGNLFAGALVLTYVQLFRACPTLFLGQ